MYLYRISCLELFMKEKPKESVINEIITDGNVLFQWNLIMHDIDIPVSNTLLQDIITLWFTVTLSLCERILYHQQIVWGA